MPNMLTTKEVTLLYDLLRTEELAAKKTALFSRTLTEKKLADKLAEISVNHEKRFNALYELL